ncbi:Rv3654c family TadE-like protein [Mycobacterium sp. PS03-16]|uniref:Rv3654c family TadE-like protein n=1 Tax=Mycobacterium sp. PS03-16 TaxID=2559611 RepID=UPI001FD7EA12|nr:Rv3654c family TadE-like protein [Mycobacterium sp. PS03-16]
MCDDSGSASLFAVAAVAVVLIVTAGLAMVGSAVVARHRAQAAADLAAVAAAGHLPSGPATACARASAVASGMGVAVTGCDITGLDVVVRVDAAVGLDPWGVGPARAAARAGPV